LDSLKIIKHQKLVAISSGFFFSMFLFSNGVVLGLGQQNDEEINKDYNHSCWRVIDCPKMKTISSGSNHTIGITFENQLVIHFYLVKYINHFI
jgi:alpha-tubulin suppressor-like RCC1 family protein